MCLVTTEKARTKKMCLVTTGKAHAKKKRVLERKEEGMRIRTFKPEFFTDRVMRSLPRDVRLLYLGLWSFADDQGRMEYDPELIKAQLFPSDDDLDVEEGLEALVRAGRLAQYEAGGRKYLFVKNFLKHQAINKPRKSELPPPPEEDGRGTAGLREGERRSTVGLREEERRLSLIHI